MKVDFILNLTPEEQEIFNRVDDKLGEIMNIMSEYEANYLNDIASDYSINTKEIREAINLLYGLSNKVLFLKE